MNFFETQEQARKKTGRLVFYYLLAVAAIIVTVYLAAAVLFSEISGGPKNSGGVSLWDPAAFVVVAFVTFLLILSGTLWKIFQLRSGGASVAVALGGREIDPETRDLHERRLLNIIEEMAIASGTPVPAVYVMEDEDAINAFAAGYTANDAAVGVTRGCMTKLTRDELQGVIAHEFSHIFNGDMRLNIRLIGVLNGILIIYMIGYTLMRVFGQGSRSRYRSSNSDNKNSGGALILFGLALVAIGGIGAFFANLIKSAVSRQREFLADASAVQFTRNPAGIAGALKKIGGFKKGSTMASPKAEEVSHMFFANGLSSFLGSLFATHPPLEERIRKIEPNFEGDFEKISNDFAVDPNSEALQSGFVGAQSAGLGQSSGEKVQLNSTDVVARVGNPSAESLQLATQLLWALPEGIRAQAHSKSGAVAVLAALLMDRDEKIRSVQIGSLRTLEGLITISQVEQTYKSVRSLSAEFKLPLLDLSLPALRKLSAAEYDQLSKSIVDLVQADGRVSLFEFVAVQIVTHSLEAQLRRIEASRAKYFSVGEVLPSLSLLLSTIAHFGSNSIEAAERSYANGVSALGVDSRAIVPREQCGLDSLNSALSDLNLSGPLVKQKIVEACVNCIATDGQASVPERELLRAVCESIGCPVPVS